MKPYLNPNIFFLLSDKGMILWEFKSHQQYSIDSRYMTRLLEIIETQDFKIDGHPIDTELFHAGIISDHPIETDDWGWDPLSRIFHVGTKNIPQAVIPKTAKEWAINNLDLCIRTVQTPFPSAQEPGVSLQIQLPAPNIRQLEMKSLWNTLITRRTCRTYLEKGISIDAIGAILYSSFGFLKEREPEINRFVPDYLRHRRSSPSGGGLNATEAYILAPKIEGILPAIYRYDPINHRLSFVRAIGDPLLIGELMMGQCFANELAFGIFIVSRFDLMWWKYPHSRAYRVSLLEAGHISQVIQLASTALGLNTWLSAAFKDEAVENILGLKASSEQALLFVGGGHSDGDDIDRETRKLLSLEK